MLATRSPFTAAAGAKQPGRFFTAGFAGASLAGSRCLAARSSPATFVSRFCACAQARGTLARFRTGAVVAPARKINKRKRGPIRVTRRPKPRTTAQDAPPADPHPRPTQYSFKLSEVICERITGGQTTSEVTRDPRMPAWHTLARWRREHEDFNRRYTIARQSCCELWVDEIIEIADDATNDYVTRVTANGRVLRVFDRESFERSRLRVDSRKWTASKLLRHVYGDKSEAELRSPDGINVRVEERNSLIDVIVRLVHPKSDPTDKPNGRSDEPRER